MKRNGIIFLLLFLGEIVVAQNFKKIDQLYKKEKVEKGIELIGSYVKKSPKSSELFLYKSLFYNLKSKSAKTVGFKKSYFNTSLNSLSKAFELDNDKLLAVNFQQYYNQLHQDLAEKSKDTTKFSGAEIYKMHQYLARYFQDTTEFFKTRIINVVDKFIDVKEIISYSKDSIAICRDSLIKFAASLVGVPYKYSGETDKGLDCSGFNQYVYRKFGIELPHNAHMQSELGSKISIDQAKYGDLIFFGYKTDKGYRASHTGLVYQNDENGFGVIHCISKGVTIDVELWKSYWSEKVLFVKRIIE